jgi:hypothetical protein
MRNAKLRTSRKMLYASGLLPVLLCHYLCADDIQSFLRQQMDALVTDRVARAFLHLGPADPALRTMAAYSDWIGLIGSKANRDQLDSLNETSRWDSPLFDEVRRIGELLDNGLTGVLFESTLSQIAPKYVVL